MQGAQDGPKTVEIGRLVYKTDGDTPELRIEFEQKSTIVNGRSWMDGFYPFDS